MQTGHSLAISSVAFSPNGRTLVSGSEDNTLRLWDVATGKELRVFGGHESQIFSVAFSPDGKTLVSGSWDGSIRLWDVVSGRQLRVLYGHELRVHTQGKESKSFVMKAWVMAVAFSPDGKTLVSGGSDDMVKLWDVATGTELRTLVGHKDKVTSVAFSPDGKTVISGSLDHVIRLWNVESGNSLQQLSGHAAGVNSVAYSPDGRTVLSASDDKTIKLWDALSGRLLKTLSGQGYVKTAVFSPDSKKIISGGSDHAVKLWDAASGRELFKLYEYKYDVTSVSFSPDGRTVVSAGNDIDSNIKLWDIVSREELHTLSGYADEIVSIRLADKGRLLMAGNFDNKLQVWNLGDGALRRTWESDVIDINRLSFSPKEHIFATWCLFCGAIEIRNTETQEILQKLPHFGGSDSVAISPDEKYVLLAGSTLGTINLWEISSGKEVRSYIGHDMQVSSVAFSPDGRTLASASYDETLRLWDAESAKVIHIMRGHTGFVNSVAFSPDGKILASGGRDNAIKLWDVVSGKELRTLIGHESWINSVTFSADGLTLFSVSGDKTMRVWRVIDGALLATLYSFNDGSWAVTDPAGRFDTADLEGIKGLNWVMPDDPLTPVPLEAFMKDYYEPRLLQRILNGEKFKPVRSLMDLNRVQPEIKIVGVTQDNKDPERANVEVEVSGAKKDYERNGRTVPIVTSANDLRLFRDGQLVGYIDGQIIRQGAMPYRKTFNVHLPSSVAGKDITFSAYAFNDDRVKSQTARQTYQVPTTVVAKKGNVYLINMGVNRFDNSAWNLQFAANDARLMRKSLSENLTKTGAYQNIVPISLISDENEHHAYKALLHAVLERLAGKPASPLLNELPGAEQLQAVTPDDLVIFTFSGHGYADDVGNFYLLTQDTGPGNGKHVDDNLLKRSISSEELSQWLKDVDAGDMTLIVDACQSAASVEGLDFKPGPMGSRGLGQLSFDKGMRILAASQADEYALEDDKIKQGLLSFALVTNGIDGFEADQAPKDQKIMLDEWLRYGVSRVPSLAEEIKTGKVLVASRGSERSAVLVITTGTRKPRPAQQPVLFDFSKKRRQVELASH